MQMVVGRAPVSLWERNYGACKGTKQLFTVFEIGRPPNLLIFNNGIVWRFGSHPLIIRYYIPVLAVEEDKQLVMLLKYSRASLRPVRVFCFDLVATGNTSPWERTQGDSCTHRTTNGGPSGSQLLSFHPSSAADSETEGPSPW